MNVVLIMTDQLSAKWLGSYGNAGAVTPNLDRLAARGVRFDNCIVNQPLCMPSRASTMTGRSLQHHGVFFNGFELGTELPTYAHVLQQAGVQQIEVSGECTAEHNQFWFSHRAEKGKTGRFGALIGLNA